MLAAIVRFSVQRRGVVIALAALLLLYGGYDLHRAGLDIFPEFSPKQVVVQTETPGMVSEQVEVLVTQRIENALAGLVGLQRLRCSFVSSSRRVPKMWLVSVCRAGTEGRSRSARLRWLRAGQGARSAPVRSPIASCDPGLDERAIARKRTWKRDR